jgi:hypothetical protein
MLSRRIYIVSSKVAFATILLSVALGLYAVWLEPQNSPIITKLFVSLAIIFAGSVLTMAVASVSKTDPAAGQHKSFRFTRTPQANDDKNDVSA